MESVVNAAALVATALAVMTLLPQIRKLTRTHVTVGVSPTWVTIGVVTNAAWTVYLAWAQLWLGCAATASVTVLYGVTFTLLVRTGINWQRPAFIAIAWTGMLACIGVVGGFDSFGLGLGLFHAIVVSPGVWAAFRTPDPAGIAPGTWALSLSGGVLWLFYGWYYTDAPVVIFAITTIVASAAVLVRYVATRPRPATARHHTPRA